MLGSAREDKYVHLFLPEDEYLISAYSLLKKNLDIIMKFPKLLGDHISQYGPILELDIKKFKKKYVNEDYPVEEYEEELLKYYEAKKELNRVFYEDWIGASIF